MVVLKSLTTPHRQAHNGGDDRPRGQHTDCQNDCSRNRTIRARSIKSATNDRVMSMDDKNCPHHIRTTAFCTMSSTLCPKSCDRNTHIPSKPASFLERLAQIICMSQLHPRYLCRLPQTVPWKNCEGQLRYVCLFLPSMSTHITSNAKKRQSGQRITSRCDQQKHTQYAKTNQK